MLFVVVVTDGVDALRKPQIYANLRKSRAYAPALGSAYRGARAARWGRDLGLGVDLLVVVVTYVWMLFVVDET